MKRFWGILVITVILAAHSMLAFSASVNLSDTTRLCLLIHNLQCNPADILQLKIRPTNDSIAAISKPKWTSSNPGIMTIDSSGIAHAYANGNVEIKVSDRGQTDLCRIEVSDQYAQKAILRNDTDLINFANKGFIEYNGMLILRGNTLTSTRLLGNQLRKTTALIINNCHNLKSFEGLHNLKSTDVFFINKSSIDSLKDLGDQLLFNELDIKNSHINNFQGLNLATFFSDSSQINIIGSTVNSFKGFEHVEEFDGDIYIKNSQLHNFNGLNNLQILNGDLSMDSTKLDSLPFEGLNQLQRIQSLKLSRCRFKNFAGLENLQFLSKNFEITNSHFKTFDGLSNLLQIGNNLNMQESELESFQGLKKLKQITNNFMIANVPIKSRCFRGLDSLQTIGTIDFSHITINDFKGLNLLKTIVTKTSFNSSSISDFEGLDNLYTMGKYCSISNCQITNFKGLKSIQQIDKLNIDRSSINSLGGITPNCKIKKLEIKQSKINKFEGIGSCINNQNLTIRESAVNNLSELNGLTALNELHLSDCDISSLQAFSSLNHIHKITIEQLPYLKNLHGLEQLNTVSYTVALKDLRLNNLEGLNNLKKIGFELSVDNTNIQNFEGLDNLTFLCTLNIKNEKQLSNLGGFDSLKKLTAYSYTDNPQIDIRKCTILTDYRLLKPIIINTPDIEFKFKKNAYNPTEEDLNKDLWYRPSRQNEDIE